MEISVTQAKPEQRKPQPDDASQFGFGDIFTDHMFLENYDSGKGWFNPRIEPYANISINPAAMGIHYGQEIFEGLKHVIDEHQPDVAAVEDLFINHNPRSALKLGHARGVLILAAMQERLRSPTAVFLQDVPDRCVIEPDRIGPREGEVIFVPRTD